MFKKKNPIEKTFKKAKKNVDKTTKKIKKNGKKFGNTVKDELKYRTDRKSDLQFKKEKTLGNCLNAANEEAKLRTKVARAKNAVLTVAAGSIVVGGIAALKEDMAERKAAKGTPYQQKMLKKATKKVPKKNPKVAYYEKKISEMETLKAMYVNSSEIDINVFDEEIEKWKEKINSIISSAAEKTKTTEEVEEDEIEEEEVIEEVEEVDEEAVEEEAVEEESFEEVEEVDDLIDRMNDLMDSTETTAEEDKIEEQLKEAADKLRNNRKKKRR